MHSPLPDSSALEAGIVEDEVPTRLSRVQENVRNLLRNSRLGSIYGSPHATGTDEDNTHHGLPTSPVSPTHATPQGMPSPTAEGASSPASSSPTTNGDDIPPSAYRHAVQQMAHQSSLFNRRAVAALDHPDLTDPSLAVHLRQQQKAESRQRKAWKRSRHGRRRTAAIELGSSQSLLCVFAALMLAATVATYIVLATTSSSITPTFHILFVLGIILSTIVFAHSMIRLLLSNGRPQSAQEVISKPSGRHRHRHHHQHRRHRHHSNHHRNAAAITVDTTAFVPPTPIPVHMPSDEVVRPDSREARPTTTISLEQARSSWDKAADNVPNPPPAYGRWRGSVRANPDLLHWQAVPSPVLVRTPALPSPTYEEVVAEGLTRPPSYVTRDSPARRRDGDGNVTEGESEGASLQARVEDAEPEPEMVEVRGIGFAV